MAFERNVPGVIVLAVALLAAATVAPGARPGGERNPSRLREQVEEAVRQHVAAGYQQAELAGELVAIHLPAHIASLGSASAIKPLRTFIPEQAAGRHIIPLEVTFADGGQRKMNITAECVAVVRAWAVRRPLKRGTRLEPQQFERRTIRVTRRERDYFTADEIPAGYQLITGLSGGMLLKVHQLEPVPAVQRGEKVAIHLRRQTLTLISPGKARREGNIGDIIPVVATTTGKRLYGRLVSPGLVVVE